MIITSNRGICDKAYPRLGRQTGTFDRFGMTEYNEKIYYSLGQNASAVIKGDDMNMAP